MLDARWLNDCVKSLNYRYSKHADKERQDENIWLSELHEALLNGRIIEQYEDTGRGESCLVAGFSNNGKPLHIVCGNAANRLVIITVYVPKPPKFKTPLKRGG